MYLYILFLAWPHKYTNVILIWRTWRIFTFCIVYCLCCSKRFLLSLKISYSEYVWTIEQFYVCSTVIIDSKRSPCRVPTRGASHLHVFVRLCACNWHNRGRYHLFTVLYSFSNPKILVDARRRLSEHLWIMFTGTPSGDKMPLFLLSHEGCTGSKHCIFFTHLYQSFLYVS